MSWPKSADGQWWLFEGQIQIAVDPTTGVSVLMLRPQGGMGVGIPAIADGPPGKHAQIDETIIFTPLAPNDPTPDNASWSTVTPPTDSTPGVYRLNLALHTGQDGAPGGTILTPSDYGTPVAKKLLAVNGTLNGFELVSPRVGDRHLPASLNNTAAGNPKSTLGVISVASGVYDFDLRVEVEAYTIVTGTGPNVVVDLVARLNGEEGGNIIARCDGLTSTERLTICSAPAPGSGDSFDKVLAGEAFTVHLRTEQRSGSDSYITSATTTRYKLRVHAVK